MREQDLPSPVPTPEGFHLRRVAVRVLSQMQLASRGRANGHPNAEQLKAFFTACVAEADKYVPEPPEEG